MDFKTSYTTVSGEHGLEAVVQNGTMNTQEVNKVKTAEEMNKLGKESFLTLLCAQLSYQDPLQPEDNTEWVSQLATYSSLEQMQNLNTTVNNSQAFSMIGQKVIIATGDEDDDNKKVAGVVDYVTLKDGKAYVSVNKKLYEADKVQTVLGSNLSIVNTDDQTKKTDDPAKKPDAPKTETEKSEDKTDEASKTSSGTETTDVSEEADSNDEKSSTDAEAVK